MEDKADTCDKTLENRKNIESGKNTDENIISNETNTIPPKKENMEVHHHPDLHHDKKYFREYFLEFLMIFLAVTMGFFAEQLREYYVENDRENQTMISLTKDLESDTLQLNGLIKYHMTKISKIDSILIYFVKNSSNEIQIQQYNLINQLFGHAAFFQNSGTLDQLNNSGELRLIRKRNVVDSIEAYVQQIKRMSLRDIYETNFSVDNNKLAQKFIAGRDALKFLANSVYFKKQLSPNETVAVNNQYLDEYLNSLIRFRSFGQIELALQSSINIKAKNLLALIKKEYHLIN